MAASKAKKQRMRLEREGRRNPQLNRGSWQGIHPVTRITPSLVTKKTHLENKHKKKWNPAHDEREVPFLFASSIGSIRCYEAC